MPGHDRNIGRNLRADVLLFRAGGRCEVCERFVDAGGWDIGWRDPAKPHDYENARVTCHRCLREGQNMPPGIRGY